MRIIVGRKRKVGAVRNAAGVSRDYRERERRDYEATIARRSLDLIGQGIAAEHAPDRLAGFTLGRLLLRWRADKKDPGSISQKQYNIGHRWTGIVHRHAAIMGYKLNIQSPSFLMVAGGSGCGAEPTAEEIEEAREEFKAAYDGLMLVCREEGVRARDVTYGVCIENWPVDRLSSRDYGLLRVSINSIGNSLAVLDKRREVR